SAWTKASADRISRFTPGPRTDRIGAFGATWREIPEGGRLNRAGPRFISGACGAVRRAVSGGSNPFRAQAVSRCSRDCLGRGHPLARLSDYTSPDCGRDAWVRMLRQRAGQALAVA